MGRKCRYYSSEGNAGGAGCIVWPKKVRSVKREMEQRGDEQFEGERGGVQKRH
jgi:hypothetical protein